MGNGNMATAKVAMLTCLMIPVLRLFMHILPLDAGFLGLLKDFAQVLVAGGVTPSTLTWASACCAEMAKSLF